MIEIKCLECVNCTGDSCKVYGSDVDKAVKSCADNSFRNYKLRMTREEAAEIIKIERECVERNTSNECDRDCINCDLLRADEEIFSAYDMAIEALQEPERKWIPVSERLPKDCEEDWVLVQIKEKDCGFLWIPRVGEERNGKWWLADDEKPLEDMFEVVAWQPLPEPYKAGEQE